MVVGMSIIHVAIPINSTGLQEQADNFQAHLDLLDLIFFKFSTFFLTFDVVIFDVLTLSQLKNELKANSKYFK